MQEAPIAQIPRFFFSQSCYLCRSENSWPQKITIHVQINIHCISILQVLLFLSKVNEKFIVDFVYRISTNWQKGYVTYWMRGGERFLWCCFFTSLLQNWTYYHSTLGSHHGGISRLSVWKPRIGYPYWHELIRWSVARGNQNGMSGVLLLILNVTFQYNCDTKFMERDLKWH